jgi:transcriptional regulator with XRE-family HTH domain
MRPDSEAETTTLGASLGGQKRRARRGARRTQRDVAIEAGISQSTISRMELGKAAHVPLATWERVAASLGLEFEAALRLPSERPNHAIQMRCHRMVVELANQSAWASWTISTPDDPAQTETILERQERHEVAIVRVWDVLGNVEAAIEDVERRLDRERRTRDDGWRVGGAVVVAATGENRRRLTETGLPIARAFSLRGDDWLAALGRFRVPMPDELGMIWTDQRIERLRPLIPYVDFRRRVRAHPGKMRM